MNVSHTVWLFTVLIGSIDCAADCSKTKKPDTIKEGSGVLQTWDHQKLQNFYIFPDHPNNAVLRIKGFGETQCNKANVKFLINDKVDTELV